MSNEKKPLPVANRKGCGRIAKAKNAKSKDRGDEVIKGGIKKSIDVVVQARPLKGESCMKLEHGDVPNKSPVICVPSDKGKIVRYADFNDVLEGDQASFDHIFLKHLAPLIEASFDGTSATCFAYGQTGAGKTYNIDSLTLKAAALFFEKYNEINNQEDRSATITGACLEFYQVGKDQQCFDLLRKQKIQQNRVKPVVKGEKKSGKNIDRSAPGEYKQPKFMAGVEYRKLSNQDELLKMVEEAKKNRKTSSTKMNTHSSRSHSILTLVVEVENADRGDTRAKFHIIDLAGSERPDRTGATGVQFREGAGINLSLSHLSSIINRLAKGERIPSYRDSRLTLFLEDSLGGSAQTLVLACISREKENCAETLGTLRFAALCKNVTNNVRKNTNLDPKAQQEIRQLELKIEDLKKQLEKAQSTSNRVAQNVLSAQDNNEIRPESLRPTIWSLGGYLPMFSSPAVPILSQKKALNDNALDIIPRLELNKKSHEKNKKQNMLSPSGAIKKNIITRNKDRPRKKRARNDEEPSTAFDRENNDDEATREKSLLGRFYAAISRKTEDTEKAETNRPAKRVRRNSF